MPELVCHECGQPIDPEASGEDAAEEMVLGFEGGRELQDYWIHKRCAREGGGSKAERPA